MTDSLTDQVTFLIVCIYFSLFFPWWIFQFWSRTLGALNAARDGLLQTRHTEVLKSDTSVNSSLSPVVSLRV